MKLQEIRDRLDAAYTILAPMRGEMEADHSVELSLELGRLLGQLMKVWDLAKRESDYQR